jgi:hypothetical protein
MLGVVVGCVIGLLGNRQEHRGATLVVVRCAVLCCAVLCWESAFRVVMSAPSKVIPGQIHALEQSDPTVAPPHDDPIAPAHTSRGHTFDALEKGPRLPQVANDAVPRYLPSTTRRRTACWR